MNHSSLVVLLGGGELRLLPEYFLEEEDVRSSSSRRPLAPSPDGSLLGFLHTGNETLESIVFIFYLC